MSTIFAGVSQLLSSPYGSMAYHLVVTFTLVNALHPALSVSFSTPSIKSRRLTTGLISLIGIRMLVFLASGLSTSGLYNLDLLLPVIDQIINSLSLIIIIWMWTVQEPNRSLDLSLALGIILILFAGGLSLFSWLNSGSVGTFITSNMALGWAIFDTLLVLGGQMLLFTNNSEDQTSGLVMFMVIFIGYLGQILSQTPGDYSVSIRLTQIAAYPLMIGLAHRLFEISPQTEAVLEKQELNEEEIETTADSDNKNDQENEAEIQVLPESDDQSETEVDLEEFAQPASLLDGIDTENLDAPEDQIALVTEELSQTQESASAATEPISRSEMEAEKEKTSEDEISALLKTSEKGVELKNFQNILNLASAQSPEDLFKYLTLNLGRALVADICLLVSTPDANGQVIMLNGYDLITQEHLGMTSFDQKLIPGFAKATKRGRPLQIPHPQSVKLNKLAKTLYLNGIGNFLSYPIINDEGKTFAAIILVSPYSNHLWSADDMAYLQATSKQISTVIQNIQPKSDPIDLEQLESQPDLSEDFLIQIQELQEENTRLTKQLNNQSGHSDIAALDIKTLQEDNTRLLQQLGEKQTIAEQTIAQLETIDQEKSTLILQIQDLEKRMNENIIQGIAEENALEDIDELRLSLTDINEELQKAHARVNELEAENKTIKDNLQNSVASSGLATSVLPSEPGEAPTSLSTRELEPVRDNAEIAQRNLHLEEELHQALTKSTTMEGEIHISQQKIEELEIALDLASNQVQAPSPSPTDSQAVVISSSSLDENALSQEQAELMTSIVQELRQPMSSIGGYIDLLLSESVGILGALQRKFLDRVKASTDRMNGLIRNLLQITALDSGNVEITPEAIELNEVMDDVIGTTSSQLREKNIILRVDLPNQLPKMTTDKDALNQILTHLLNNAEAATPVEGEITLKAEMNPENNDFEDDAVLISVSDTGEGIPESDIPRVFSRLYRAENALIQGVGDTGVGLSIAKTLTEALGGKIWVQSEPGTGSTFSVLLPCSSNGTGLNGDAP